ncbi:hypothetical protein [Streptomyces sp. SudanB25_2051]|uniref:hypothetical protein n=1 Tax=Streptomyces sp. SudanB25_2051 TaxID=3035275 RepID=UPI003F5633AA
MVGGSARGRSATRRVWSWWRVRCLPAFDREAYKQCNTVERCINRIKQWRGLATRYDKTATIYLAGLHLAAIFIWSAR